MQWPGEIPRVEALVPETGSRACSEVQIRVWGIEGCVGYAAYHRSSSHGWKRTCPTRPRIAADPEIFRADGGREKG